MPSPVERLRRGRRRRDVDGGGRRGLVDLDARRSRRALRRGRPRDDARVVARVGQDANLRSFEPGIALDSIDERRATRRRGKETFEDDERRTELGDGLQRLQRLRIGEHVRVAHTGAGSQRVQHV